ncbi:sodium- and chloride-dependent neutral and basic amino acid transporter B(0+)-like [Hemiscyllium ocellatum]|uniref:sodium- and chloride-dependent neutral and basic amino acid transporter B(0+)-like n=1 Tax=Hemiscyllium ocellatum TaxID=170820 RepID=UPI002965FE46|nr:sodium- and chloride-dependent neutral and basic amino acid transporter B(0+)-like [Hemiscyllium ocellatum]
MEEPNLAATSERVREGDENVERGNWSSKIDYLLSVIGSAVGLGNVWRFPYLAYRNGGGIVMKSKIQGRNKHKDNNKVALRRTSSIDETGEIVWYLALCLFLAWLIIGAVLSKGIKSSGKSAANPAVNRNDENVKRGNWSSKTDYLLSMIGCAVGLGNVWRFPYLAYKNGGGVFLIPYSIMLGLVGIPIFFLESSFGQFASLGPVAVWKSVPMLQGVGVTMVLLIIIANISYACIIGYSLYYLFASFQSPLDMLLSVIGCIFMKWEPSLLIEQYWDQAVLHRTSSLDETGEIVWHLALCLLLAWLMVGTALLKGIKSSGKVVYFTAIIPYVVLTILLIRGVTLEGASKGIEFYIGSQSDFSKLADAQVWKDAATQIFYSTSVGWGSLITLSSYNKFHNNCYQDTIIVCVVNCATSVFAGFIIFSTLGHMAHVQNKPVSEVARSGFGLAFIAYPEALAQLPWATLWSILFFFMLLTLRLDTLFASFGRGAILSKSIRLTSHSTSVSSATSSVVGTAGTAGKATCGTKEAINPGYWIEEGYRQ